MSLTDHSIGIALTALGLLTVSLAGCLLSSDGGTTVTEWDENGTMTHVSTIGDPEDTGLDDWPGSFDSNPATHDFDGDGTEEVIAHSKDTNVYVFDPYSGEEMATLPTSYPPAWHIQRILNAPTAGVLAPGQPASIVIANHAATISVWQHDPGASEDDDLAFDKRWEQRMNSCHDSPGMDAGAVLADLTGDETLEILVHTEEQGLYALEHDGELLWEHCWAGGNGEPVASDLDGDGSLEAVFASDSGFVSVFDGASGTPLWTFDASEHTQPASIPHAPTVADVDGEEPKEILFTARNATHTEDVEDYERNHMLIFAIRGYASNGTSEIVFKRQPDWANPISYTQLVVDDVDGDGRQDIFGMDWNTIGHRPGDWERLGPANVFRLDEEGQDVWTRELSTWWSNTNIALGNFDEDGDHELLVNAPVEGGDGIWRISAQDGKAEGFLSTSPWKVQRMATPADLDDDGTTELLFPVRPMDESLDRGAVLHYDLSVDHNVTLAQPADPVVPE